jgi:hypothetical protein
MLLWYYYTKKLIKFSLPWFFILKNLLFWGIIYIIWILILNNFSVWLYFDFIIYGWILFVIYSTFLYFSFKRI